MTIPMTTLRHRRLAAMLADGKSMRECAISLHTSRPALIALAISLGLNLPDDGKSKREKNPRDEAGFDPLPPGHPISVAYLPKLASLSDAHT